MNESLLRESLKAVVDPELGIDIVNLGLVYGIDILENGKKVHVLMTLTTMGCPIFDMVARQIKDAVQQDFPDVVDVDVELTFSPAWNQNMMTEEGKDMARYMF